ncbi:hypothetical protein MPLA_670133 [Mesorhizobium sp. ORS 3359]|nr:hypothetical protein MPLA_670133 [Mesorhizobium sp. ORS 3359]
MLAKLCHRLHLDPRDCFKGGTMIPSVSKAMLRLRMPRHLFIDKLEAGCEPAFNCARLLFDDG